MSKNTIINAVIALVEERPKDAREMIRSSGNNIDAGALQNRLSQALRSREAKAKIEALKSVLTASLRIDTDKYQSLPDLREAYVQGIGAVETIIDDYIEALEP